MDQIKIGQYVAEKRRAKDLTQEQLAEKLGKSRKAVSKWERGVCLPDVSVYTELCELLGITLNEFFAGEDIKSVDVASRSEKNLLGVAMDGSNKRGRLKKIVLLVSLLAVLLAGLLLWILNRDGYFLTNYVRPYAAKSHENLVVNTLTDGLPCIYEYKVDDKFTYVEVCIHKFVDGKEISDEYGDLRHIVEGESREGLITLVSDIGDNANVRIALGNDSSSISTEMDIYSEIDDKPGDMESILSVTGGLPGGEVKVEDGKEIPIGMYYVNYDEEASYPGFSEEYEATVESIREARIPYAFLFTVKFGID